MKKLFIVLAIATAFTACNSDKKEGTTETSSPATTVTSTTTETATSTETSVSTDAPATTATTSH